MTHEMSKSNPKRIRWGVVGTGRISEEFTPDLQHVSGGEVRAVWGRTAAKASAFAATHRIEHSTDNLGQFFSRDDIDAVYIATPISTHRDFALAALDAGKHVLVEKPMAASAVEVAEIFARAQMRGLFVMEAMWMRFQPVHQEVMRQIGEGLLGEVRSVRASFGIPFRASEAKPTPADGGSAWLDRGIYTVTLAHWALGTPVTISAGGKSQAGVDIGGHATLNFGDHRFAQLACSSVEFIDHSASISGTLGWVTLDPMFWTVTPARIHAGSRSRIFGAPALLEPQREGNGFRPMLRAVHEALGEGLLQHPHHDLTTTIDVATTLDAIIVQTLAGGPEDVHGLGRPARAPRTFPAFG